MIGHIYRIIHVESDIQYVGSTFNEPRKRWQKHKQHYNEWSNNKRGKCEIYPSFQEYGIDKFKLILIKSYNVVDRKHLTAYEQLWVSKFRCVNKNNPFLVKRLYKKQHYQENKEAISARLNAKHQCECGGRYTHVNKLKHFRTLTHQRWLSENS